jgi:hypothetical protein
MQLCITTDNVKLPNGGTVDLGSDHKPAWIETDWLYASCVTACKQQGVGRPVPINMFGKELVPMFGPPYRPSEKLKTNNIHHIGHERPRAKGYGIPSGAKWQELLDARLGIPKQIEPPEPG